MVEREGTEFASKVERSTFILRRVIPHRLTVYLVDATIGKGLTYEGHRKLMDVIARILKGERVPVDDVRATYEDSGYGFSVEGAENIPTSGATLFVGNHTKAGPLMGMGQYFEAASEVDTRRVDVVDKRMRESVTIAQKGLTTKINLPFGRKIVLHTPLTDQFYDLAAASFNWVTVSVAKFNKAGEITNRQELPRATIEDLISGGALLWYPQGTHREADVLSMPQKGSGFLNKLKDMDITVMAMRFVPKDSSLNLFFGQPVHVQGLPRVDGQVSLQVFVKDHLEPLGQSKIL